MPNGQTELIITYMDQRFSAMEKMMDYRFAAMAEGMDDRFAAITGGTLPLPIN